MTKKEFDTYRFSINTCVKVEGDWYKIIEIDFESRIISVRMLGEFQGELAYLQPREIKGIKED